MMKTADVLADWPQSILVAIFLLVTIQIVRAQRKALDPPAPGPFLARFTSLPFHWIKLTSDRTAYIERLHQKYGPVVQLCPGEVSFADPEALRDIYGGTRRLPRREDRMSFEHFGIDNLTVTTDATLAKERRRIIASVYAAPAIMSTSSQEMFNMVATRMQEHMGIDSGEEKTFNMWLLYRSFGTDIMSHLVFGSENALNLVGDESQRSILGKLYGPEEPRSYHCRRFFLDNFPNLMRNISTSRILPLSIVKLGSSIASDFNPWGLEVTKEVLGKKIYSETSTHVEKLVQKFRENEPKRVIPSENYIASDCLDSLLAGSVGPPEGLMWLTYHLSLPENCHRQRRLRSELQDAGCTPRSNIELSILGKLPYLDCLIRETLRRNPPTPFSITRLVTQEDVTVMGYKIPLETEVSAQPWSVHRHPTIFHDPETWNPERWEVGKDTEEYRQMHRMYWPFGSGARMCLGQYVAMTQIRLLTARIYSSYETSLGLEWRGDNGELNSEKGKSFYPYSENLPIVFKAFY